MLQRLCSNAYVEFSLTMLDGFILKQENNNQEGFVGLIYEYLPSIVITAGNFLVPALGDQIALVERYSPSTTIILALLRFALLLGWRNRMKSVCRERTVVPDQQTLNQIHTVFDLTCRSVVLRLVSLGVLLWTLWTQITCEGNINHMDCSLCQYNHKLYPVTMLTTLIEFIFIETLDTFKLIINSVIPY